MTAATMTEAGTMTEGERADGGADAGVASAESVHGPRTAQPAGGRRSSSCIPSAADLAGGYRDSTWSGIAEELLLRVAVLAAFVFIVNVGADEPALWILLALPVIKLSARLLLGWWLYRAGWASRPTNESDAM